MSIFAPAVAVPVQVVAEVAKLDAKKFARTSGKGGSKNGVIERSSGIVGELCHDFI